MSATVSAIESMNLVAGALITEVVSPDGRHMARRSLVLGGWLILEVDRTFPIVRQYPDGPGMNALVAMRRFQAEREQTKREKGGE